MINIHDTFLKRILLIVLAASVLGILVSNLFIYPSFTKMLIKHTESEAVLVGNHMATMVFPESSQVNITHINNIQHHINEMIDEFSLYKLKVFAADGKAIFSTDKNNIGKTNEHDYFHNEVARGRVFSKVVKKNSLSLEGQAIEVQTSRFQGILSRYHFVDQL